MEVSEIDTQNITPLTSCPRNDWETKHRRGRLTRVPRPPAGHFRPGLRPRGRAGMAQEPPPTHLHRSDPVAQRTITTGRCSHDTTDGTPLGRATTADRFAPIPGRRTEIIRERFPRRTPSRCR